MPKTKPYRVTSIIVSEDVDARVDDVLGQVPATTRHAIMRTAMRLGLERLCEASSEAKARLLAHPPMPNTRVLTKSSRNRHRDVENASTTNA
jgi:hypothetical protein